MKNYIFCSGYKLLIFYWDLDALNTGRCFHYQCMKAPNTHAFLARWWVFTFCQKQRLTHLCAWIMYGVFVSSFCIMVCALDVVAWMGPSSRLVICIPLLCLRGSSSHWFPSAFVNSLLRAINCAIFLKSSHPQLCLVVTSCGLWGKKSATLRLFEAQFHNHTKLDTFAWLYE